ncbi:fanconi-associated nuclease 1 [Ptiloglossa arizonensis]|uniref:fanconi-associated nuclease 1 n=1 Tax=Ptiloglossa arizonensis TaxID=3350558 RepID=UPI003FA0CB2E
MLQQTRIDQFYKSTSGKQVSNVMTNSKKNVKLKSIPYTRNRKKNKDEKQNISLPSHSVKSEGMSNCIIIDKEVTEAYNINLDDVEMLFKNYDEIESNETSLDNSNYLEETSKQIVDIKHAVSPINDAMNKVKEKAVNNNEIHLRTPKKELENSLRTNRKTLTNNNNTQLKKALKEEPKDDNPLNSVEKITLNVDNNIHLKQTPNKMLRTPENANFTVANSEGSTSMSTKSNYSPKESSNKSLRNITPKKLFGRTIDTNIIINAIEHMNLRKQGAIPSNNFNLEQIYSNDIFNYQYNHINTKASVKYEVNKIISPNDLNSKILFTTIFTVLSEPVNCGYFDENELDFIYSIITLPVEAQTLLVSMIKRKRTWHRKSNIKYPEIISNLQDVFKLLVSRSVCTFDIKNEDLSTLLDLLQVDEIRQLCRNMKINHKGKKKSMIGELLKLSKNKSLFPGMKGPSNILHTFIFDILDYCVSITDRTWNIIDKIMTLLIPNQDPKMSIADTFFKLCDNYLGKVIFPNVPENRFPIFSCKSHLIHYIQAKSALFTTLQFIEKKNWDKVQYYGNSAMNILPNMLTTESLRLKNSILPMHVRRFMPGYIWLKILSKCIDAFKKNKDKERVVEILNFLLEQDCHMCMNKGKWYNELALIKMFHHKDVETSALIIMQALETKNLSRVDKIELLERANKICKRKTGVKPLTKTSINKVLDNCIHQMPKYKTAYITINASTMSKSAAGNKSIWCIESSRESQSYGSVEMLAAYHYCEHGFSNALHCEGELPILLFITLFWEELYDMHIPGAFVTPYQCAPDDLFTEHFYENRREKLDMKLQIINDFDSESLSSLMETRFKTYSQYQSIMNPKLIKNSLQLKEIVYCLGVQGVIGICKRLIENFKLWKAGFPDLIVWNYKIKWHKIVEVKGPRDVLSIKQQLWLEYLNQLGLNTEICLVQDKSNAKRSIKKIQDLDDYE